MITLVAAVCTLVGAVLLMRVGDRGQRGTATKYLSAAARRSPRQRATSGPMSERMIWDALDEGRDPTDRAARC